LKFSFKIGYYNKYSEIKIDSTLRTDYSKDYPKFFDRMAMIGWQTIFFFCNSYPVIMGNIKMIEINEKIPVCTNSFK